MSDTPENGAAPTPPRVKILGQFIRDLSFENVAAQNGTQGEVQPDIQVQVNLDARQRPAENQYEVMTRLKIEAKNKSDAAMIFAMEIDYVGIFHVENIPEDQLHPYLLIECPRLVFPFLRRIVSDVSRDGGFPPLNLDQIDFLQIYRQEAARRAESKEETTQ